MATQIEPNTIDSKCYDKFILTHADERNSGLRFPYNLVLQDDKRGIFYIGGNHSTDPENEQFEIIDNRWAEFINKPGQKICLVEGGFYDFYPDPIEAKSHAEPTYLVHLATIKNVEFVSIEPDFESELEYLEGLYPKDLIFYFWMSRYIRQWPDIKDKWPTNEETYIRDQIQNLSKQVGSAWDDFNFSIEELSRIHKEVFSTEFQMDDFEHFTSVAGPNEYETPINQVSSTSSRYRDIHMVKLVEQYWKEGKSIFAVLGYTHVIRQEQAIRAIFTAP